MTDQHNNGVLDMPPLTGADGVVPDCMFVHGSNGEPRWIVMQDEDQMLADSESDPLSEYTDLMCRSSTRAALNINNNTASSAASADAAAKQQLAADLASGNIINNNKLHSISATTKTPSSASSSSLNQTGDQLWVSRYGATRFSELLSDERINLEVLQWMVAWKKRIAASAAAKSAALKNRNDNNNQHHHHHQRGSSSSSSAAATASPLVALGPQPDPIILIAGPPGVGKTTLAHVVARHCGFDPIEVNASFSRSAADMKHLIETVTSDVSSSVIPVAAAVASSSSSSGAADAGEQAAAKLMCPKCLILDEIDGSTNNVIKILLGTKSMSRPVICLANNLYAPVLREMRAQLSFVRQVPPLLPQRIVSRLEAIAEMEKLVIDRHSLMELSLHCAGDIRQCLNTLFFVSRQMYSRGSAAAASRMLRALRVREPVTSIWTMWEAALERREKSKYIQSLASAGVMTKEQAAATKMDLGSMWVSRCAKTCPEIETVLVGLQEWFTQLGYPDYTFRATAAVCEAFAWADRSDPFTGNFGAICEAVVASVFRSCATLSARPAPIRNTVPREAANWSAEAHRSMELIMEFLENTCPSLEGHMEKVWCTPTSAALDVLPHFVRIVSLIPLGLKLAPGVVQLSAVRNMKDAAVLRRLVELLSGFGVSFQHDAAAFVGDAGGGGGGGGKDVAGGSGSGDSRHPSSSSSSSSSSYPMMMGGGGGGGGGGAAGSSAAGTWKMVPDWEQWSEWQSSSSSAAKKPSSSNYNNNKWPSSSSSSSYGKRNYNNNNAPEMTALRAAAGVAAKSTPAWQRDMRPLPNEVRELLVGEITQLAGTRRMRGGGGGGGGEDIMSGGDAASGGAASSAAGAGSGVPNVPPNSARRTADLQADLDKAAKSASTHNKADANVARDFFGRIVAAPPKGSGNKKKIFGNAPAAATGAEEAATSITDVDGGNNSAAAQQQQREQALAATLVKYRYFDGSSNAVRKPATSMDFL